MAAVKDLLRGESSEMIGPIHLMARGMEEFGLARSDKKAQLI